MEDNKSSIIISGKKIAGIKNFKEIVDKSNKTSPSQLFTHALHPSKLKGMSHRSRITNATMDIIRSYTKIENLRPVLLHQASFYLGEKQVEKLRSTFPSDCKFPLPLISADVLTKVNIAILHDVLFTSYAIPSLSPRW